MFAGQMGANATGGIGGKATSFGDNIFFQSHYTEGLFATKFFEKWYHVYQGSNPGAIIGPGLNGTFKTNCTVKKPATTPFNASASIIAYKDYVRANLGTSAWKSNLWNFTNQLSENGVINSFYDLRDFLNEFKGLESDYYRQNNETDFISLYQTLRHRFEDYRKPIKNRKYWQFLYAAIISKQLAIRNHTNVVTVTDLLVNMKAMKDIIKETHKNRLKYLKSDCNDHKRSLSEKIHSANQLIGTIAPTINKTFQHTIQNNWESVEQMQSIIVMQQIITPMRMIESLLALWIQDVNKLAESVPKKTASVQIIMDGLLKPQVILTSAGPYKTLVQKVIGQLKYKFQQFKEVLNELRDILKQDTSAKLSDIKPIVANLTDVVDKLIAKKDIPQASSIHQLTIGQKTLVMAIESTKLQFQHQQNQGRNVNAAMEMLIRMQNIMKCFELGLEFYKKHRNDRKKMSEISVQVDQLQGQLNKWKEYEQDIFAVIIPQLSKMERFVAKASIVNATNFELDTNNWNILNTFINLENLFRRMRQRPLYDTELEHCIERMKHGIETLISVYNRLNVYSDKAKMVTLIQDLEMESVEMNSPEMKVSVQLLNETIHSNLMLEHCITAAQVLKLRSFPIDLEYLKVCQLPAETKSDNSNSVRNTLTRQIDDVMHKMQLSNAVIREEDSIAFNNIEFNVDSPFYTWNHKKFNNEINRLLNGEEILLYADIPTALRQPTINSIRMNAVKFNKILIHFNVIDQSRQNDLNEKLKDFQFEMTMIGSNYYMNYYRCNKMLYSVPIDIDISFNFHISNLQNGTIVTNDFYNTIMKTDHFLSPYSVWKIKLLSKTKDFSKLKAFTNEEIDLMLIGRGGFIRNDDIRRQVCNANLDEYYRLDNVL